MNSAEKLICGMANVDTARKEILQVVRSLLGALEENCGDRNFSFAGCGVGIETKGARWDVNAGWNSGRRQLDYTICLFQVFRAHAPREEALVWKYQVIMGASIGDIVPLAHVSFVHNHLSALLDFFLEKFPEETAKLRSIMSEANLF